MTTREAIHILQHSPIYWSRPLRERLEMVKYQKQIFRAVLVAVYFGLYAIVQTYGG